MKREFEYFLFENFDADKEAENPQNPRRILGEGTDALLSEVVRYPAGECSCAALCDQFGEETIRGLIDCGVLRQWEGKLWLDCPVFLGEDAEVLHQGTVAEAASMVDLLEPAIPKLYACCDKLKNGFSRAENLYHILCGMVLDGSFFDYLNNMGIVATSRWHPSGLDYLTTIYEKCEALRALSNGLLCSYNRISNDLCALQSFGDANGARKDFYRLFRLMEQGEVTKGLKEGERILREHFGGGDRERLLREIYALIRRGRCDPAGMALLEEFGYVDEGRVAVPMYLPEHREIVGEIETAVEEHLGEAMLGMLLTLSDVLPVTAVKHQVNRMEVANELYHIFFGSINEELVRRGHVAQPKYIPGEGRYLKCIEIYQ